MFTHNQITSGSTELESRKPLCRVQQYLVEMRVCVTLLRELWLEIHTHITCEKFELYLYRTIILLITSVHLVKFLWFTIIH
jgi:hypothetical protein